jgi:hypothetical protein
MACPLDRLDLLTKTSEPTMEDSREVGEVVVCPGPEG